MCRYQRGFNKGIVWAMKHSAEGGREAPGHAAENAEQGLLEGVRGGGEGRVTGGVARPVIFYGTCVILEGVSAKREQAQNAESTPRMIVAFHIGVDV